MDIYSPKGPHFGGLWKSKVKSFKHHLKRVVADSTLTFEEFSTLITQIEACILLKTAITTLKRPIVKLILLPVNPEAVKSLDQAKE